MASGRHTGRTDDWPGIHIFCTADPTRTGVYRVNFGWGLAPVSPLGSPPSRMPRFPVVVVNIRSSSLVERYDPPEHPLDDFADDDFKRKAIAVVMANIELSCTDGQLLRWIVSASAGEPSFWTDGMRDVFVSEGGDKSHAFPMGPASLRQLHALGLVEFEDESDSRGRVTEAGLQWVDSNPPSP